MLAEVRDVFFRPFIGHCSFAAISGKDNPTHAASNSRSPFPHLCTFKSPYHGKAENDIP